MSFEDFNDWDAIFLEQAIRVEEEIISKSSRNPTQHHHHHNPLLTTSAATTTIYNFSPPRELSQNWFITDHDFASRPANGNAGNLQQDEKEIEIERLKRELGRVSKQLGHLEQECTELKKDRDKKEKQLKSVVPWINARDETHCLKNAHVEYEAVIQEHPQISLQFQNASTSNDQPGPEYSASEAKASSRISLVRGRTSESIFGNAMNFVERIGDPSSDIQLCEGYCPVKKNVQVDGLSVTTDLRRRILIDNALTTSNECSIEKIVLPETTAQPKCTKAVGVQTDASDGCSHFTIKNDLHSHLLAIWDAPRSQRSGRDLVSKLFVTCAADLYVLFRCMGMNMPSEMNLDSLADEKLSDVALNDQMQSVQSVEAAKVSRLYLTLRKLSNEIVQLDTLFEAVLDLCALENVVVVHRSLCIVRAILQLMLSLDTRFDKRDNVMVEGMCPKDNTVEFSKSEKVYTGVKFGVTRKETSFLGDLSSSWRSFDVEIPSNREHPNSGNVTFVSSVNWVSLFEIMHRIATRNTVECIQVEAISVMNLILMRSSPCLDREKFGSTLLFESMSRLLQKEVSLCVRKQVVRLLFLLLNCPKFSTMFCSSFKDDVSVEAATDVTKVSLAFQGFNRILEGLAECIKCKGHGTQELQLRRHAIIVLAFVASSGKAGFEVLLNPGVSKQLNFLELIMQALASEMDAEAAESAELSELSKERTSLIREALILLNRLASSSMYSSAVLGALTCSRDMASLTIDVANRISTKGNGSWKPEIVKKRKMESEIVDLARVFRSRVFNYLGDNIS